MMKRSEIAQNSLYIGLALLLFVLIYILFRSIEQAVLYSAIFAVGAFLIWTLLFHLKWFYLGLIALIPISQDVLVNGSSKVNLPSEILLVIFVGFSIIFVKEFFSGLRTLLKHPLTILLIVDLALTLLTSLTSEYPDVGLKRFIIQTLFFLGFFVPIIQLKSIHAKFSLWLAYAIGLIPVMYFTLTMHAHYDFNPKVVFSICQPYFNDHTVYGACLAFIIPFLVIICIDRKSFTQNRTVRLGIFLLLIVILFSVVLALSRAALLSLVVALLFVFLLKMKVKFGHLIMGLVTVTIIAWSFSNEIYDKIRTNEEVSNDGEIGHHFTSVTNINNDASNLERINRWVCAIRMFKEKPIAGFGPGVYQFEYNKFQSSEFKTYISTNMGDKGNAHSEYLSALSEKGIFGGLVFLLLVFSSIAVGMQNHYLLATGLLKSLNLAMLLGLITFFFHAIFNAFLDQSKMAFLVYSALAVIVVINLQLKHEKI